MTWLHGRSIFGYFDDLSRAEAARDRLRAAGFIHAALVQDSDDGHSGIAFDGGADLEGEEILLSADPSAPGLGPAAAPAPAETWWVVAHTDGGDEQVERAIKIIKHHGGQL